MACGEWRLFLQSSLAACNVAQLLPELGVLGAEERRMIISDFRKGGRHLGASAKLNLSFWEECLMHCSASPIGERALHDMQRRGVWPSGK